MKIFLSLILILNFNLASASTCSELIKPFLETTIKKENSLSIYSNEELEALAKSMEVLNLSIETQSIVFESIKYHFKKVELEKLNLYLEYSNTFRGDKLHSAILDISQLGQREINSKFVLEFEEISQRLPKKYFFYKNQMSYEEFSSLYFSCKSAIPNAKNNNAKKIFAKFSLGLGSVTTGASYVYYNKDKEKDFAWYAELGYDLSFNAFTSYMGSKIQTNPSDPQYIKSMKNYLSNRLFGIVDIALYPAFFPGDESKPKQRITDLRNNPNFKEEIQKLHQSYEDRGIYTKFKNSVVETYRVIIRNKEPINIAGVNWSTLTEKDLDRIEVQEVLTLAATAELYEMNRGPLLDTGDKGLDRYTFSSLFSLGLIPRNMVQSYISYQILCMGQNNPAMAITQAAVFTTSINFFVGQAFYKTRKEAINN